jgi:biopolymer transport protein ExbD
MAKEKGKTKQKKMNCRVDFTPMVDMNMLLITFFMLCTSLSKPQTMEISMPSNDKNVSDQDRSKVKESQAITLLLAENDRIFYFTGLPSDAKKTMQESTYKADGIRKILQEHNIDAMQQAIELKKQKDLLKITADEYTKKLDEIKGGKETPTVIIKPLDTASYKNLIDALDEMQICNIGKYVIDKMDADSKTLIKEFEAKGGAPTK